ncbi:MAG: hypothetical protein GQ583_03240, partial [Methyloprofundus sp.]|nr:hypothetical protein [Methyloprofundus sp.]
MRSIKYSLHFTWLTFCVVVITACSSQSTTTTESTEHQSNGSEWLVVDCLLPGQIRKLGQGLTYLTQRKPIKTSSVDCEIRGGEYVSYDRADYRTALSIWLPQAQQGNPEAQVYVGEIYEKGHGLAPDYAVAAHWYQKAADQGNSRGQINLGYLYEKGLGVDKDLVLALNWYRKASGLESEDIAFASTIEMAVKAEYEDELNLLRNELDNRQAEIINLQSQLERSRKNYKHEQIKLNQLKTNLKKSNTQLTKLKNTKNNANNTSKIHKYEEISQIDADRVRQQLKIVEQMKASLSKNNSQLASKLKQAEQRSIQLSADLIKHKQEEGLLKTQLITLETQLSTATLSIAQLTDQLASEQQLINDEKQELDQLKKHLGTRHTAELGELKTQLAERQQLIKKLETERTKIAIEKNDLTTGQSKTLQEKNQQLERLNGQLQQQNQNLKKQHTKIARLEAEK